MNAPKKRRALLQELTLQGVRLTPQRRALIDTLQEAERHLDADSLLALARQREPNLNRATVYRTIELLKRMRLIDELDLLHLEGEKHFYEVRSSRDHVHLACFHCGRIEEFTSPLFDELKAEIASQNAFAIRVVRLEVGGVCGVCSTSREETNTDTVAGH